MALQIVSDLHLESPKSYDLYTITPRAPTLTLLGDIGTLIPHKEDFLAFLTQQLKQFRTVLFVPGNHEAYGSSWPTTLAALRAFEEEVKAKHEEEEGMGEFVLLDRNAFKLPDTNVVVLGCSLFSKVPAEKEDAVSMGLNDFFQIEDWDVGKHNAAHQRDLDWLNAQVAELENEDIKIVVLTHWSPTVDVRASDPLYRDSAISTAFATDLKVEACWKSGSVRMWAFGHTHFNCDFGVQREGMGELRVVSNQRGYYFKQAERFDDGMVTEI